MPRILTGDPGEHRFDAWGQDTWLLPDEDLVAEQILVPDPDRHAPAGNPLTHCPVCGRELSARELCSACGDETEAEAA